MRHSLKTLTRSLEVWSIRRALTSILIALVLAGSGLVYVSPVSADLARSGSTVLVSAFPDGTPADGGEPSVSADGRYVAFASWDKLVPEHRDNCQSVYRKDMLTGELLLLAPGTCSTFTPSISADGNKVLYLWGFCNRGIPNYCSGYRAYVHDIAAGTTITVSDTNRSVEYAKLSADGNYAVLLQSDGWDVWGAQVRDTRNPSIVWHIGSIGLSVPNYTADLSADGRYVVFVSQGKHVAQDNDNRDDDIYLFDRNSGSITLVGVHPSGEARYSGNPAISADGRTITFATTEVPTSPDYGPIHLLDNVYIRNLASGATSLVSRSSAGVPAMEGSLRSSISSDGNLVAFGTFAPLSLDTNPESDIFMRNVSSGRTSLLSILPDGTQGYGYRGMSDLADGGRFVVFESVLQPDYLPYERRVYLRDLQPVCSLAVCPLDYP